LKDCFALPELLIVPDRVLLVAVSHAVLTLCGFLVAWLVRWRLIPAEAVVLNVAAVFLSILLLMRSSHSPEAAYLLLLTPLLFVFGNTVFRFSFQVALPFSAFCVVASAAAIMTQPGAGAGLKILMLAVQLTLAASTLIATYQSEAFERTSYLLTLRETLRGESLVEKNRELRDLSQTDQLTGVANRRAFDWSLEDLWNEHLQSHTPLALLMIDIDHFKRLNDTYGHANGDVCLKRLARRLQHLMRPHQWMARYGGEEFVVLLEGEGAFQAASVAERLRREIETMPVQLLGDHQQEITLSISVGCATMIPTRGAAAVDLFSRADTALYAAKKRGRNRVEVYLPQSAERQNDLQTEPSTAAPINDLLDA
jgi:diguanylate cyclase (GGDEF)-like protein